MYAEDVGSPYDTKSYFYPPVRCPDGELRSRCYPPGIRYQRPGTTGGSHQGQSPLHRLVALARRKGLDLVEFSRGLCMALVGVLSPEEQEALAGLLHPVVESVSKEASHKAAIAALEILVEAVTRQSNPAAVLRQAFQPVIRIHIREEEWAGR